MVLLVACGDDDGRMNSEGSAPTAPGTLSDGPTGASVSVGSSSGDTTMAGATGSTGEVTPTTGVESTDSSGGGLKLDVGSGHDFGGDPTGGEMLPLTCANIAMQPATSVGCEFWAVDLPMLSSNELAFGISVGNPTEEPARSRSRTCAGPARRCAWSPR
jgi:hypothetical protein